MKFLDRIAVAWRDIQDVQQAYRYAQDWGDLAAMFMLHQDEALAYDRAVKAAHYGRIYLVLTHQWDQ